MKELWGRRSERPPPVSESEGQRQVVLNSLQKHLHFFKVSGKLPWTISIHDRKAGTSQELVGKPPWHHSSAHTSGHNCLSRIRDSSILIFSLTQCFTLANTKLRQHGTKDSGNHNFWLLYSAEATLERGGGMLNSQQIIQNSGFAE